MKPSLVFLLLSQVAALVRAASDPASITVVCNVIRLVISSSSGVYFPGMYLSPYRVNLSLTVTRFFSGDELYTKDTQHWAASSSDDAACSVEPGSTSDLSRIVCLSTQTQIEIAC